MLCGGLRNWFWICLMEYILNVLCSVKQYIARLVSVLVC